MSQVTADLEYFKCDVCFTYFHRDIFCDHRRHCNGAGSTELNKRQAAAIADQLDRCESQKRQVKVPVAVLEKRDDTKLRTELASEAYAAEQAAVRAKLASINPDDLLAELDGM